MTKLYRVALQLACSTLVLFNISAPASHAQAQQLPFRNGEWLIEVRAGTPRADVDTLAASVGATVTRTFAPLDVNGPVALYLLKSTKPINSATTLSTIATLKKGNGVIKATPNEILHAMQTGGGTIPNDPRWNLQWDMTQINMPLAWTLEKGKDTVVVADIDTGFDTSHPDFDKSRLFKPFNSITKANNADPVSPNLHGTMTGGVIAAATNNGTGQAGVTWQNIKFMPILSGIDDPAVGFAIADLVTAVQYVQTQASQNSNYKFVVNMSLGGQTTSDDPTGNTNPMEDAILTAAKNGILFCISAGNNGDAGNPPATPARLAGVNGNVICVTATGVLGTKAFYSEFRPYSTVAAPGGDNTQGQGIAILVPTFDTTYAIAPDAQHQFNGGTSAAAPHVSGVAALLLSVPGVSVADIKPLIQATARRVGGAAVPSPEYGYGIIDAYAALLKVAVGITIIEPTGLEPVETLRPAVRFQVAQIQPENLVITVDGGSAIPYVPAGATPPSGPYFTIENITATIPDPNDSTKTLPSTYQVVLHNVDFSPGQHTLRVVGTKPGTGGNPDQTVTTTGSFTVMPHVIPAGRSMISFPYYQYVDSNGNVVTDPNNPAAPNNITPQMYLGTNFQLARWLPDQERYAFYSTLGQSENGASFTPMDVIPHLDGDPATPAFSKWPVGLGFFADVESSKPILTKGQPITDRAFIIPLKVDPNVGANGISWNMIGDPFPFDVPFNSVLVDTPTGRISLQEAATRGYILPNIYTYSGGTGYTFATLPAGALQAWTGHWVGITSAVNLNLVVPPAKASRAAVVPSRAAAPGGWSLQIGAHTKDLHDTFNFIGMSSSAKDGYDLTDAPKPPMTGPYVSIGTQHSDWAGKSGVYASDMRSVGSNKTWTVVANTDQANADVTVSWNTAVLPKNVRLIIKDDASGQTYDMRSRAALTYNSGSTPAPRTFTITAGQSLGRALRITNLNVRPNGRGSGTSVIGFSLMGDATYEVTVLSSAGHTVTNVATRAAAGSGDVSLIWNGRDNSGKSVAAGTYLVQVRATTTDGESVRAIQPFTVVR